MKITIEFKDVNEYLELEEKTIQEEYKNILPPELNKLIDGNKEKINLINAMSNVLAHLIDENLII